MAADPVIHTPSADAPPLPVAADSAPAPVAASMHTQLARLAELVATPATLAPDARRALRTALVALHAKMRDQAPA